MKTKHFNAWLRRRVRHQTKVTIGACAGMAVLGLLAFAIQGGLLYLIFSYAYSSRFLGVLTVVLLFGSMTGFVWLTAPSRLGDSVHEIMTGNGTVKVRLAPTLSNAWTFAMGSLETDQSIPERILSVMMLMPRMSWTSFYIFRRISRIKAVDIEGCSKILRIMLKRSERVEAAEIADQHTDMDAAAIFSQMSLIDGVVFLTKDEVGISLANRFRDDLERDLTKNDPSVSTSSSPFD